MSKLIVEVVEFQTKPHPNADNLMIATIKGKAWQCIITKSWQGENIGVYLPIDSVLPDKLITEFGLGNLVHNGRIRTVRLRGELSQGLILPMTGSIPLKDVGTDMIELLGITKFEPPEPIIMNGLASVKPKCWQKYTDIQNFKNFPNIFKDGEIIYISEKLHGYNCCVEKSDCELFVSSHNQCLKRDPNNIYWKSILPIQDELLDFLGENEKLYGEVIGGQDLKYGLSNGKCEIRFFDYFKSTKYANPNEFIAKVSNFFGHDKIVPNLYIGPFSSDILTKLSSGNTVLGKSDHIKEGIVIRPDQERYDGEIGRVVLKYINDDYLVKKGKKTEFH